MSRPLPLPLADANVVVDLLDEIGELWTVPVVLNVSVWLAEVDVEQQSKGWSHWSVRRPGHWLQQQWYNWLL